MREETFGPFVPRTFWGVAVAVVLIAVLVPIRAFAVAAACYDRRGHEEEADD